MRVLLIYMFVNDLVGKTPVSLKTHRFTLCADKYLVGDCPITFGPLKFVHAVKMHVFHLQWCFTIISIVAEAQSLQVVEYCLYIQYLHVYILTCLCIFIVAT